MRPPFAARSVVLCAVVLACRAQPPATVADARTALNLPPEAADAIRGEMRTMLGAVHAILAAPRDSAAVRAAAHSAGMSAAADTALEHVLPEQFLVLGTATHRQFDSLALAAGRGISTDSLLARLARLTANCVSCHAAYRLAPPNSR